jgi:hypothetical protein
MIVKDSSDGTAAVDPNYFWQPIATCPIGRKVQLINKPMGCATYGVYDRKSTYWTHWAPLPKFSVDSLKEQ